MSINCRIMDSEDCTVSRWDANDLLASCDLADIRYSKGFLRFRPEVFLSNMALDWLPLLDQLGIICSVESVVSSLEFPERLSRVVPISINGEPAVIGYDEHTESFLCERITTGSAFSDASDVLLEYLERRFLATLGKHWGVSDKLDCQYLSTAEAEAVEVMGAITLALKVADQSISVHFGFGPKFTDILDERWRIWFAEDLVSRQIDFQNSAVSVEIGNLVVPSTVVTDFLRTGTLIELDVLDTSKVLVKKNDTYWAQGSLLRFNNRFAVRYESFVDLGEQTPERNTRIGLEICSAQINMQSAAEHNQQGAILLTGTAVSDLLNLTIGGETVSYGRLVTTSQGYAVEVLERA